jgi:hypothetical protein
MYVELADKGNAVARAKERKEFDFNLKIENLCSKMAHQPGKLNKSDKITFSGFLR